MNAEAKCASLDRISNLPSSIIENILCLVPIRDAVRTSILSKNWRYNWVKIPKLEFNERIMFDYEADENQPSVLQRSFSRRISDRKQLRLTCKFFYAVLQVLLRHEGPILEFRLELRDADDTCVEIDQIIIHLARNNNAIKKFTFDTFPEMRQFDCKSFYQLPRSIFSLHQLTDLNISCCSVDFGSISNGFESLTNLSLWEVGIYKKTLLPLLSSCPLLKRFKLMQTTRIGERYEDVTTIELLNCLPMIEHLSLYRWVFQCFNKNRDPRELPRALVHLKYFYLADMAFLDDDGLDTLSLVMRSSPGLEKIKLTVDTQYGESLLWNNEDFRIDESTSLKICSDIWLEHLKELKIVDFSNMFCEMEFVKLILAKSPVLKKVSLVLEYSVTMDTELEILTILTSSPRVSPLAEVIVKGSVFWRGV